LSRIVGKLFLGNPTIFRISRNTPQSAVVSTAPIPVGSPLPVAWYRDQKPPIRDPAPAAVVRNLNGRYFFFHESPSPLPILEDVNPGHGKTIREIILFRQPA